jgi:SAM-dependent methyltransferase
MSSPAGHADFDRDFFEGLADAVRSSAAAVVPIVIDRIAPRSVVDVGCGTGAWLAAFARHGVEDFLGIDGDWIPPALLEIPPERFVSARLDRPLNVPGRYDLALSLEVAEHLPQSAAKGIVKTLVQLAPCVLFSAAVPRQGGRHHVNEQWQDYWAELFAAHGYEPVDAIRPRIWSDPGVSWWYRQNTLVFARPELIAAKPALAEDRAATATSMLSVVHPRMLDSVAADPAAHVRRPTPRELSVRDLADAIPHVVGRSLRWRLRRLRG